jgi:uncharacterized membrane protein YbhN (UPF0104 family)
MMKSTQSVAFKLLVEALEDDKRKRERSTYNAKFIGKNVARGILSSIGALLVYGLVAWLIIKHGWSSLKDVMAVRTMSIGVPQLPPKM